MWGDRSRSSTPETPWYAPLTQRHAQVGQLIAAGLTNAEIAARFGVSKRTLEVHILQILMELDLRTRAELALWIRARDPLMTTDSSTA